MANLLDCPDDVLRLIFRALPGELLLPSKFVCRKFLHLLNEVRLPKAGLFVRALCLMGYTTLLQWAIRVIRVPIKGFLFTYAAEGGQVELVKWLMLSSTNCTIDDTLTSSAASSGNLELVKFTISKGVKWTSYATRKACAGGHLHILEWIKSNVDADLAKSSESVFFTRDAAENGRFEVLKWLKAEGALCDESTCVAAARSGHFEMLKYLYENGCSMTTDAAAMEAARFARRDILQWLFDSGFSFSEGVAAGAAQRGDTTLLRWLMVQCKVQVSLPTAIAAVYGGQLNTLRWLRSNSWKLCEDESEARSDVADVFSLIATQKLAKPMVAIDTSAASALSIEAAKRGHVAILKFLREQDAYCDPPAICEAAADADQLEVLRWMAEDPAGASGLTSRAICLCSSPSRSLDFLVKHPKTKLSEDAAYHVIAAGRLDLLQIITSRGVRFTPRMMLTAAQNSQTEIMEWLFSHRCPFDSSQCEQSASAEVRHWLRNHPHSNNCTIL